MEQIKLKSPAKINLFLKIMGKRPDGYHDIFSWFQAVDLFDRLHFKKSKRSDFNLSIENGADIPCDGNNLIIKTAELMFGKYGLTGGLEIRVEKNIPVAAGLAGGSSNAAATIVALDRLFGLGLTAREMADTGLAIGSDVPFFFSRGQAEITGRGERIRNIALPVDYFIVQVTPAVSISTAESYRRLNLGLTRSELDVKLARCVDFTELVARIGNIGNDFERLQFETFPELRETGDRLRKTGAALTRMSGSGPTIYGLYEKQPKTDILREFIGGNWHVSCTHPIILPAWDPEEIT